MAIMLNINEMLLAAVRSDMPGVRTFVTQTENLMQELATRLAEHLQVDGPARCNFHDDGDDNAEAVLLGRFSPKETGQPVPPALSSFDNEGDWIPVTNYWAREVAK